MYDCSCDYDPPAFFSQGILRARKLHRCYECSGHIVPGEQYERSAGKWDGNFSAFKICQRCRDLRVWVQNNVPCLCVVFGNQDEESAQAIEAAYDRAREEVVGLWFGYQRRRILRDRLNRARRAEYAGQ